MIEFKNFKEHLQKGFISVSKVNDAYAITKKQFNPDTGEPLSDEVIALDPIELEKAKAKLVESITQIDNVLTHLKTIV